MPFNRDDDDQRAVEPGDGVLPGAGSGAGAGEGSPEGTGGVQSTGSVGGFSPGLSTEPRPGRQLSAEERLAREFTRWRQRFHDVPDLVFDQVVLDLRAPEPINAIARGLIEQGYCPSLHPGSVRMYLTRLRDAMGWPRYSDQLEPPAQMDKLDETEELIEALPPMRRLAWLIRIQQSRVRKALRFEGRMAHMILPMASAEIKLLSDLLDKEIEVALRTGDLKTVPQAVTLEGTDISVTEPAEAYRVVLAFRRLQAMLAADGRVDDGGGDAVGTPLPGAAESGPVEPGPGADGEHGRT